MKLIKLICPNCGGNLNVEFEGRKYIHCPYCQSKIGIDDERREININKDININKNIQKKYTNETEIVKSNNEIKMLIIYFLVLILIVILPLTIIIIHPKIEEDQEKISAGDYRDLEGQDYRTVKAYFESAGFTNIELIDLNNSGLAVWKKGKVEKISVGGKFSFDSIDYFDKDTKVIISYH